MFGLLGGMLLTLISHVYQLLCAPIQDLRLTAANEQAKSTHGSATHSVPCRYYFHDCPSLRGRSRTHDSQDDERTHIVACL
ncbi:uncharacterized protein EV420DRAFT_1572599 [Desarmillaria tabescens]|uniref:Secreted protein n=1 Tax=Armillaria tabescens TaxID=1929756 RepID=A0AA39JM73_ARMTA|nr:uncharacterized protein EV420DRAFT_1572599 [Desarmillaria tabescens]KAK0445345.1 hypothetical protein EV420DRAFT_1572599 [Desarmillaria tabescens]